jgi:hypothetical protein
MNHLMIGRPNAVAALLFLNVTATVHMIMIITVATTCARLLDGGGVWLGKIRDAG